jgi:hypothetical protein
LTLDCPKARTLAPSVEEKQEKNDEFLIERDATTTSITGFADIAWSQRNRDDLIETPVQPILPVQAIEPLPDR